ncbi:MAG: MazG nucleotide pyrophosphohydrolase domain-containing protein [Phycisphaerae bacterium]
MGGARKDSRTSEPANQRTGEKAIGGGVWYTGFGGGEGGIVAQVGWPMTLDELQRLINEMYSDKDRTRGSAATFMWLNEEIGELAAAIREGSHEDKCGEFADVMAWLVTLANVEGVNLTEAIKDKYGEGCPGCGRLVCTCDAKS